MGDEKQSKSNVDRLLSHLKDDSLADRLVRAYKTPEGSDAVTALKKLLAERLEAIRRDLDRA